MPFILSEWEEKQGWYLHSLTPQQELAIFLHARGMVFHRHQKYGLALVAHAQATVLWPRTRDLGICLASSAEAHLHEMGFHRTSDEFAKSSVPRDPHDPFAEVRQLMEFNRLNAAKYQIPTTQRQSPSLFPKSRN